MSSAFSRARRFCTSASFMRPTSRRLGSRARFLDGDGDDDELREACCAGILRPVLGRPDGLIGGARSASSSLSTDERFLGVRLTNDDRDGPGAASSTSTSSSLLESAASCMTTFAAALRWGRPDAVDVVAGVSSSTAAAVLAADASDFGTVLEADEEDDAKDWEDFLLPGEDEREPGLTVRRCSWRRVWRSRFGRSALFGADEADERVVIEVMVVEGEEAERKGSGRERKTECVMESGGLRRGERRTGGGGQRIRLACETRGWLEASAGVLTGEVKARRVSSKLCVWLGECGGGDARERGTPQLGAEPGSASAGPLELRDAPRGAHHPPQGAHLANEASDEATGARRAEGEVGPGEFTDKGTWGERTGQGQSGRVCRVDRSCSTVGPSQLAGGRGGRRRRTRRRKEGRGPHLEVDPPKATATAPRPLPRSDSSCAGVVEKGRIGMIRSNRSRPLTCCLSSPPRSTAPLLHPRRPHPAARRTPFPSLLLSRVLLRLDRALYRFITRTRTHSAHTSGSPFPFLLQLVSDLLVLCTRLLSSAFTPLTHSSAGYPAQHSIRLPPFLQDPQFRIEHDACGRVLDASPLQCAIGSLAASTRGAAER